MKTYRIILSSLVLILIGQIMVMPARAAGESPANIAFVDPATEIKVYQDGLSKLISIAIVNTSEIEITLQVNTFEIDILQPDASKDISILPGEVKFINFSILSEKIAKDKEIAEEKKIEEKKVYSGFLIFTSQKGDFIYKVITIDTRLEAIKPEIAISLLAGKGDISINWTDLKDLKFSIPILNTGKNSTTITAKLQFLGLGEPITGEASLDATSISELELDLSKLNPQHKSYEGFLTIQDGQDQFLHNKVTLNFPASDLVSPSGSELAFLGGEDPVAIKYFDLTDGSTFKIWLINKGLEPVTVTQAKLILPGLVDQAGKEISSPVLKIDCPNLTINPVETGSLQVKLADVPSGGTKIPTPRDGSYTGYLLLNTRLDQALIVKKITLEVSAPPLLERLSRDIPVLFQHKTGWQVRLSSAEWTILLLLLSLLLVFLLVLLCSKVRVWIWNARGRLGPVYVDEIGDKADLTAKFREILSNCGIMPATNAPTPMPGASSFVTVLSKTKIPEVAVIQEILNFLVSLKTKLGYVISSTLSGKEDTPPVGITIQVKQSQNGQVKRIKTIMGDTYSQVVKEAAFYTFFFLTSRKAALRHIPTWSRFPTPDAFRFFKDAGEQAAGSDQAIKLYEEAAKEAPFNALLRHGWGDSYEVNLEFLDALNVYLEATCIWPELYGFWYRIAAVLSFADGWFKDWTGLCPEQKGTLVTLLKASFVQLNKLDKETSFPEELYFPADPANVKASNFIHLSTMVWSYLERQFKFGKMIANWLKALFNNMRALLIQPVDHKPRLPRYYWGNIPFLWNSGIGIKREVILGKYCSQLRAKSEVHASDADVDKFSSEVNKILGKLWNNSNVYYNAACFYAILASKAGLNNPGLKEEAVKNAMASLKKAFRDPASGFDVWVKKDPDLQSLHKDLEFMTLVDLPDEKEMSKQEKVRKSNYFALILVREGSKQQIKLLKKWGKSSGLKLTPEELLAGANHQVAVWRSFTRLAEKPADATAQEQFWDLVMLYTDRLTAQPDPKKYPPLPDDLTQKALDDCWKAIKEEIQPNPKLWEDRAAETKLFLKHAKTQKNDVWELWSKAETRKWEYLTERIKKLPGLEKP